MSELAIEIENLGKEYKLGASGNRSDARRYKSLRDTISSLAHLPLRSARSLASKPADDARAKEKKFWALEGLSSQIRAGEVVGVVGRNGAGKSTLLKVLSRITEPTTGRVKIHGKIGSLLEVGTGFHPELTGRDNIYLNGAILGMKKVAIDQSFDDIVSFAEVGKFIDTPVKHYSSGMYLRLAFAVAAHLTPDILIIDEVLAVGDAEFQKKCMGKMGAVARQGRTVLFVSHNTAAILSMCQRVLLLDHGRLIADGPAHETISRYTELCQHDSLAGAQAEIEVTEAMRRASPKELKIRYVGIRNSDGDKSCWMKPSEPFKVEIEFDAITEVISACFGVGVSTLDGMRVLTTHHVDTGQRPIKVAPGRYSISATIEAPLKPGSYTLDVGAVMNRASGGSLDYLPGVTRIEIAGMSQNEGFLEIQHNWSPLRQC